MSSAESPVRLLRIDHLALTGARAAVAFAGAEERTLMIGETADRYLTGAER